MGRRLRRVDPVPAAIPAKGPAALESVVMCPGPVISRSVQPGRYTRRNCNPARPSKVRENHRRYLDPVGAES